MFTGIIEETGTVRRVTNGHHCAVYDIQARKTLERTDVGDSIAVDGVCLTVTRVERDGFRADVMHETINRSTLSRLRAGSDVNLERAMRTDGRFGGHIVTGHVDGVGTITDIRRDGNAIWYTIQAPRETMRGIVEKGSIAVNGISLTVAAVSRNGFAVSVIPHTLARTSLHGRHEGDQVNLETDIIGKYVEKILQSGRSPYSTQTNRQTQSNQSSSQSHITKDLLARYGF
ncbi:MAG TPA: riboflavin synthase [Bifidobacterium sp.]|nr:riboflavin synthase [Bifidobacterium sp.]